MPKSARDTTVRTNRLIQEKSPYLLQHAHNPVDWYPWGTDAFAKARAEGKPIFLSVGYSTCHWCHVMERESFENETIASLLNEHFVAVKVDREERPDVDRMYMTALQAMGQNGGWPMSMFLTPGLKPFYGGTYFPPESRYGRAGFPDVLRRVSDIWKSEQGKVEESAETIVAFLSESAGPSDGHPRPGRAALDHCFDQFRRSFDTTSGGFGHDAKFPRPAALKFLLRYFHRTRNPEALSMAEFTLQAMARGGIRDHIGGGFHRYTVDAGWRLPHFEKMLYDQAQIADVYLDAFQLTRREEYASTVRSTLEYVLRDMTDPGGGFYSAEDADSPLPGQPGASGEGAFYLWTRHELIRILGESDGRLFCVAYGVEEEGNAPFDPQQEYTGKNILHAAEAASDLARILGKAEEEVRGVLTRTRLRLLMERSSRPRPALDDKVLASWNGLMLGAFSRAGAILGEPVFLKAADRAAEFLLSYLVDPASGSLHRRYRQGEVRFDGNLDDYAYLVSGLIDLYEATGIGSRLEQAVAIAGAMIDAFGDGEGGGFFDTAGTDASVLVRLKERYDGAEPAGNSVAATVLLKLAVLTGRDDWRALAERTIGAFAATLEQQPVAMPNMASALDLSLSEPGQVVIVGSRGDAVRDAMLREVFRRYLPGTAVVSLEPAPAERTGALDPDLRLFDVHGGKATAYVCENLACSMPTNDPAAMASILDGPPKDMNDLR